MSEIHTEQHAEKDEKKEITIYVNGRPKTVTAKELNFQQVVLLAFPDATFTPDIVYTATVYKSESHKEAASLMEGDTVKVKEGTSFDVDRSNRS